MAILHNGNEYSSTKIINYSAAPDYNRGVTVDNIQSGNYQATDNGFLFIQLQSQQSNPTKVSVVRSKTPITDTGTEIASRVIQQFQYSETLTVQVMAREYYKLIIEGVGNPQVLSCVFYPYASTVPIKLTENITMEQVEGLGELAVVDNVDLTTQTTGVLPIGKGGTGTDNGFNFQNFFEYNQIGTSNATLQEFWDNLPLNISGCTYIPYGAVADLIDKFGILFFIKAANRRYLKFIQFSTNFGTYNEYVLIDDASKSNITFNDFIHTTANGFPKKAYPLSGVRRYSSAYSTEEEIYNLKMNIGDVLSVNNLSTNELLWRYKTRFPQGGNYYVDFFKILLNQNNKIARIWSGYYAGGSYIANSEDTNVAFLGKIVKIS